MVNQLQAKIERDSRALAFVRGFQHGVMFHPLPRTISDDYAEGYRRGRETIRDKLGEFTEDHDLLEIPPDEMINLIIRA